MKVIIHTDFQKPSSVELDPSSTFDLDLRI